MISAFAVSGVQPANADSALGKYLIDFFAINTPAGNSPLTQQMINEMISGVSSGYATLTSNQITFSAGKFMTLDSPKKISSGCEAMELMKTNMSPRPEGFKNVILVAMIMRDPALGFAGVACTNYSYENNTFKFLPTILLNGYYPSNNSQVDILAHELGHNLGLGHANSMQCTGNVGATTCEATEYGDKSDVMGSHNINYGQSIAAVRFSAPFVDRLGLLKENQIAYVNSSTETTIAPLYPLETPGTKLLYLPIYNSNGYSIEYRPAIGLDAGLSKTQIPDAKGSGWYMNNIPSYGLQIRNLAGQAKEGQTLLPTITGATRASNYLFVTSSARQGFDPGSRFTLPDGTLIEFLSADDINGAKVRITRTADTEAPTLKYIGASYEYEKLDQSPKISVKSTSPGVYTWPKIRFEYSDLTDNRKISEVAIDVDGKLTPITNYDSNYADGEISSMGEHLVKLVVKDYSGNAFSGPEYKVNLKPFTYPKAQFYVDNGKNPQTDVVIEVTTYEDESKMTYSLENLPSSAILKTTQTSDFIRYTITNLPRNSVTTAILKRQDPAGNPAEDTPIKFAVEKVECTKSLCYVGAIWNVDKNLWSNLAPTLQLQQNVNGKWVVVASAKPNAAYTKSNKNFYGLTYINNKAGTYSYRLYQPAFTANGKKYPAYIGSSFTQRVIG